MDRDRYGMAAQPTGEEGMEDRLSGCVYPAVMAWNPQSRLSGRRYLYKGTSSRNDMNLYFAFVTEQSMISAVVVAIAYLINMYNRKEYTYSILMTGHG